MISTKGTFKVKGGKKFTRIINIYKKEKNWTTILRTASLELADEIRDNAEKKVYTKFTRRSGKLGKSIKSKVTRRGNNVFISLSSNHPGARIMEKGGISEMPYAKDPETRKKLMTYGYQVGATPFQIAFGIWRNQPFEQATYFMRNALSESLPKLESKIARTALRMKR